MDAKIINKTWTISFLFPDVNEASPISCVKSTKYFYHIYIDWFNVPPFLQLAGGTASMQQLKERLEKDLLEV